MQLSEKYELVVGLEIHVQLQTQSKLFCGDSVAFGAAPNEHVSPVTLGHPGTLPKMNRKAIEYAVKMGLACHCGIERHNYFARKNYFYPDLPKGYQVSQHTTPICQGGFIAIKTAEGERAIRLNRIHMEEDAGKSMHEADPDFTNVDYNRAGTALIEIVSEPDLRSAEEVYTYVAEVRKLVRYLGICDGNMEEGSLRCDANISLRKKGETSLGTKVEVKNLNSLRFVKKAVEAEAIRLAAILDRGGTVQQQTRSFDPATGTTFAIRDKEDADDYRYFPEPDLTPFALEEAFIDRIKSELPALPAARIQRYTTEWNLPAYDAQVITEEKSLADFYEALVTCTNHYKAAANWLLGPVKSWLNEQQQEISSFPLSPSTLAGLVDLTESGKISFTVASTRLFPQLLKDPGADPSALAASMNLLQVSDSSAIEPLVEEVMGALPDKVAEYRKGKKGLLALFVGEVMKRSRGKADPKIVNRLLEEKLKNS